MATIGVTNAQNGVVRNASAGEAAWSAGESRSGEIPSRVIDRAVLHGRRLRAQAIAAMFAGLARWIATTARAAVGRRATKKLGCGECGDMMRA